MIGELRSTGSDVTALNAACAAGMAIGMMIPIVPQLVPVQKATAADMTKTMVGSSHAMLRGARESIPSSVCCGAAVSESGCFGMDGSTYTSQVDRINPARARPQHLLDVASVL